MLNSASDNTDEDTMDKKRSETQWAQNLRNMCYMGLNIFCVVSIVILNKILYGKPYHFNFANTLVCLHFVVTAACCTVCERMHVFEARSLPFVELLKLSGSQVGSVAFVNFSLLYNSVGLYQVLKLMNIPVICVMEFLWLGITYTRTLKASLGILTFGVGLATFTEVEFSLPGFIHGLLATVATGCYQILCGSKQKEYNINALQLLHQQAPVTAAMLGVLALLFDDTGALVDYKFDTRIVMLLLLTGFIAFGVNFTVFLIIGKTSPVTYQVVGHFKTCAVIFFGFVVLHQPFEWKNMLGIVIAVVGMVWYTYIKQKDMQHKMVAAKTEEERGDEENPK